MSCTDAGPRNRVWLAPCEMRYEVATLRDALSQLTAALRAGDDDAAALSTVASAVSSPSSTSSSSPTASSRAGTPERKPPRRPSPASASNPAPFLEQSPKAAGIPSCDVQEALLRYVRAVSLAAQKRAACAALAAAVATTSAAVNSAVSSSAPSKTASANDGSESVVRRLRQLDAEVDALRGRLTELQEQWHHLSRRTRPPTRQQQQQQQQQLGGRLDSTADTHQRKHGDEQVASEIESYTQALRRQQARAVALEDALALALSRHRGRQSALAYCNALRE